MQDQEIFQRINALVEEEHALLRRGEEHTLSDAEQARMRAVEVALDQCWDLLRQRRARRHAGQNPDDAQVRDAATVERYVQ